MLKNEPIYPHDNEGNRIILSKEEMTGMQSMANRRTARLRLFMAADDCSLSEALEAAYIQGSMDAICNVAAKQNRAPEKG